MSDARPDQKWNPSPGERKLRVTPTGVRGVEIYEFPWVSDPSRRPDGRRIRE